MSRSPPASLSSGPCGSRWWPTIRLLVITSVSPREHEFEAWLLTWLPGQGTEWHDHGGSAGAFITLQGSLTERHAEVGYGPPRIIPVARDLVAGTLRPFGSRHLHQVTNQGDEPAVSLHVYAPSLVEMHQYEVKGDLLVVANSQLVGTNW